MGHQEEDCGVSSFGDPFCIPNIMDFCEKSGFTKDNQGHGQDKKFLKNTHPMGCCVCGDLKYFFDKNKNHIQPYPTILIVTTLKRGRRKESCNKLPWERNCVVII